MGGQRLHLPWFVFALVIGVGQTGCEGKISETRITPRAPQQPPPKGTDPKTDNVVQNPNANDPKKEPALSFINGAADGYINASEVALNEPVLAAIEKPGDLVAYTVVSAASRCEDELEDSYNYSVPTAKSLGAVEEDRKICVRIRSQAQGTEAFLESPKLTVDVTPPEFLIENHNPFILVNQPAEFTAHVHNDASASLKPISVTPADILLTGEATGCTVDVSGDAKTSRKIVINGCSKDRQNFGISLRPGIISDMAGNTNQRTSVLASVGVYSTLPNLTVELADNFRTQGSVTVSGACARRDEVKILVDSTQQGDALLCGDSLSYNRVINLTGDSGKRAIEVVAMDEAKQQFKLGKTVFLDKASPTIDFKPVGKTRLNSAGSVVLKVEPQDQINSDDVAWASQPFRIDPSKFKIDTPMGVTCAPPEYVPDTKMLTIKNCTGNARITVWAEAGAVIDQAGNASLSSKGNDGKFVLSSEPLTVDNEGPALKIEAPAADGRKFALVRPGVPITGTCEKTGGKVSLVSGATATAVDCNRTTGTFSIANWSFSPASAGSKSISVSQADDLGNMGSSAPISFELAPLFLNNLEITGLAATIGGGCEVVSGESYTATATLPAVVVSTTCVNKALNVALRLQSVPRSKAAQAELMFKLSVMRKNSAGTVTAELKDIPLKRRAFVCPDGYVGVPRSGLKALGHPSAETNLTADLSHRHTSHDFCVMKYPAKDVDKKATSVAAGQPWTNISRGSKEKTNMTGAIKECHALGTDADAGKYALISNTQWQTIARNIESVAANWTGNAVGSGQLQRGHSANSPGGPIANGVDDSDPYFGYTKAGEPFRKRIFTLNNGELIWDFAGNVWQWVRDDASELAISPALSENNIEFSNLSFFPLNSPNRLLFAPAGSYSSAHSTGLVSAFSVNQQGIARGGHFGGLQSAGIYAIRNYSDAADNIGFRCVYMPLFKPPAQ